RAADTPTLPDDRLAAGSGFQRAVLGIQRTLHIRLGKLRRRVAADKAALQRRDIDAGIPRTGRDNATGRSLAAGCGRASRNCCCCQKEWEKGAAQTRLHPLGPSLFMQRAASRTVIRQSRDPHYREPSLVALSAVSGNILCDGR